MQPYTMYAQGPMVVLRGGHFLMSEIPLYWSNCPSYKECG